MRLNFSLIFLSLLILAFPIFGETILLPVVTNNTPGAFGSMWSSSFSILNRGGAPLLVHGAAPPPPPLGFGLPPQEDFEVPANQTLSYVPYTPVLSLGAPSGKLLHVDDAHAGDLKVNLRIQDTSRESSTFGTEIPTVRESSAATKAIDLLIVPADDNFRSLVRVYDFEPAAGHAVLVRLYKPTVTLTNPATDQLLSETTLNFQVPSDTFNYPGYAQMYVPSGVSPVRVEIIPLSEGLRFWAFASVTNNATQHVTLVTP
jgi:hypothetical protein